MIYLGADHAGFKLKETVKLFLDKLGQPYEDLGNATYEEDDDYPDFAQMVARKVAENGNNRGILICGSGIGMCIAANKIKGARAVNANNPTLATMARRDNNANILCLGGRYVSAFVARRIVKAWLDTRFDTAVRHRRRVSKIE